MDPVLNLLIQAHGETLGRLVYGSVRLAETAVEQAQKKDAQASVEQDASAPDDGTTQQGEEVTQ